MQPAEVLIQVPAAARPALRDALRHLDVPGALRLRDQGAGRREGTARDERIVRQEPIRVIDGDTFSLGGRRFRLRNIDTPERGEPGFAQATARLRELLSRGSVRIVPKARDKYGRIVAEVFVDGVDVAALMREEGYAKPGYRPWRR